MHCISFRWFVKSSVQNRIPVALYGYLPANQQQQQVSGGEEAVVGLALRSLAVAEIDGAGVGMAGFARPSAPFDQYAVPNEALELLVVLEERLGKVHARLLLDGLLARRSRTSTTSRSFTRPRVPLSPKVSIL